MTISKSKKELVPLWDDPELPQDMVRPWVKKMVEVGMKGIAKRVGITPKSSESVCAGKAMSLLESLPHNAEQNSTETYLVSHPHSKQLVKKQKKAH